MFKIIPAGSYGDNILSEIKISSRGLYGNDLSSFIKVAGNEMASKAKTIKFASGEVPIYLTALGSTESVGPNKNGDGFKIAALKKYHDTFVKSAKWYRNHKARSKSYGVVKLSHFNEPMSRVELIVALNGTKQAADRNGGHVADEEIEMLKSGKEMAVSMGCKVPFDVCSSCGNMAKTRAEYCNGIDEGGSCKYGGLANHIGSVAADGHHLHADNTKPLFFDISKVYSPADRTAYVFGKVASNKVSSGAELAEVLYTSGTPGNLYYTDDNLPKEINSQVKLAATLAELEKNYKANSLDNAVYFDIQLDGIDKFSDYEKSAVLKSLSEHKVPLSVESWLSLITNKSIDKTAEVVEGIKSYLPFIFSELNDDPDLPDLINNNPTKSGSVSTPSTNKYAYEIAQEWSLDSGSVRRRVWESAFYDKQNKNIDRKKIASNLENNSLKQLAKQYAIYQIGFINDLDKLSHSNVPDLIVRFNRVN